MRIKLYTKPFTRNYPLRLAVVAAFALAAIVMVATGNSPWAEPEHSPSWLDGASWAKQFDAFGALRLSTCGELSVPPEFDRDEWLLGCREYTTLVGTWQP
jgi:hypothetical protein